MRNSQSGRAGITFILFSLLVVAVVYFYTESRVGAPEVGDVNTTMNSLTDADFIAAVEADNAQSAEVVARGDVNADGYEDAIVQEMHCGASCSIGLHLIINNTNTSAKEFVPAYTEPFEPAYMSSSAAKSQLTEVLIKDGIISLTGYGLACTPPGSEELCTEANWNILKTVSYRFDGKDIIQL